MRLAIGGAALALAAALGLAPGAARAGLFDDEEARKAIVELRARVAALDDQAKLHATTSASELAALNTQLTEQLAGLRRGLLDLNNQLEAMRGELARLRGNDEQLARDIAEAQRRQKDIAQAFDERMRKLEPIKVAIDGTEVMVDQNEKKAYDDAIAAIRTGDFDKSVNLLGTFQRRYPAGPYSDSARFWYGNALYGKRDYKEAINAFRNFVTAAPEHPRAAEALLALANSQAEMKDPKAARKTIEELMKAYPASEAAQAGKERLASIK
ncbi:Cell division coordinator CpoB [Rubrivivax sp. A210]|uniref:tol-pal system protein YbgF n=1 Tax=Rubrivivax sp. A210 TaxID=2772301 RepID=UPI00191AE9F6|nr:tol-pal system protein YbgF [Rubrivivax sp. A210]CAD5372480.1 Cell division coordinator CpoB [Rubrivivax sp. A210]